MSLLMSAVKNNADWCEIVCASHGVPGIFSDDAWVNSNQVPTYYPNIVTLTEDFDTAKLDAVLTQRKGPWFIKDSFNTLGLAELGFEKLFEATWLHAPSEIQTELEWSVVGNENELAEWLEAWGF